MLSRLKLNLWAFSLLLFIGAIVTTAVIGSSRQAIAAIATCGVLLPALFILLAPKAGRQACCVRVQCAPGTSELYSKLSKATGRGQHDHDHVVSFQTPKQQSWASPRSWLKAHQGSGPGGKEHDSPLVADAVLSSGTPTLPSPPTSGLTDWEPDQGIAGLLNANKCFKNCSQVLRSCRTPYVSRLRRKTVHMKIPFIEPEEMPVDFLTKIGEGLKARTAGRWSIMGVAVRRGCVELALDILAARLQPQQETGNEPGLPPPLPPGTCTVPNSTDVYGSQDGGSQAGDSSSGTPEIDSDLENLTPLDWVHWLYLQPPAEAEVFVQACGRAFITTWDAVHQHWLTHELPGALDVDGTRLEDSLPRVSHVDPPCIVLPNTTATSKADQPLRLLLVGQNLHHERASVAARFHGLYMRVESRSLHPTLPAATAAGSATQSLVVTTASAGPSRSTMRVEEHAVPPWINHLQDGMQALEVLVFGVGRQGLLQLEGWCGRLLAWRWQVAVVASASAARELSVHFGAVGLRPLLHTSESDVLDTDNLIMGQAQAHTRTGALGGVNLLSSSSAEGFGGSGSHHHARRPSNQDENMDLLKADDLMTDLGCWMEFTAGIHAQGLDLASFNPESSDYLTLLRPASSNKDVVAILTGMSTGQPDLSDALKQACLSRPYQEQMLDTALQLLSHSCGAGWLSTASMLLDGLLALGLHWRTVRERSIQNSLTLLHQAVCSGSTAMVQQVVAWGEKHGLPWTWDEADPGVGITPLHLAVMLPSTGSGDGPSQARRRLLAAGGELLGGGRPAGKSGSTLADWILAEFDAAWQFWHGATDAQGVTPAEVADTLGRLGSTGNEPSGEHWWPRGEENHKVDQHRDGGRADQASRSHAVNTDTLDIGVHGRGFRAVDFIDGDEDMHAAGPQFQSTVSTSWTLYSDRPQHTKEGSFGVEDALPHASLSKASLSSPLDTGKAPPPAPVTDAAQLSLDGAVGAISSSHFISHLVATTPHAYGHVRSQPVDVPQGAQHQTNAELGSTSQINGYMCMIPALTGKPTTAGAGSNPVTAMPSRSPSPSPPSVTSIVAIGASIAPELIPGSTSRQVPASSSVRDEGASMSEVTPATANKSEDLRDNRVTQKLEADLQLVTAAQALPALLRASFFQFTSSRLETGFGMWLEAKRERTRRLLTGCMACVFLAAAAKEMQEGMMHDCRGLVTLLAFAAPWVFMWKGVGRRQSLQLFPCGKAYSEEAWAMVIVWHVFIRALQAANILLPMGCQAFVYMGGDALSEGGVQVFFLIRTGRMALLRLLYTLSAVALYLRGGIPVGTAFMTATAGNAACMAAAWFMDVNNRRDYLQHLATRLKGQLSSLSSGT